MPDAYELHDLRFPQIFVLPSAANALSVTSTVCPVGKIRTMLAGEYVPSVAETRTCYWAIFTAGYSMPVTYPASVALSPTIGLPLLTMGMELKLLPGEYVQIFRDVATAGSSMTMVLRYIETELPPFRYDDPQNKIRAQKFKHGQSITRGISGGGPSGTPPGSVPPEVGGGGRRGGREI
jgi:hypothetical protein